MDFISNILAYPFRFFYNISGGNYLLALFLFALLMKIILLPFGIKQQKNTIKQARLRPKEMAIRNKYKGRTDKATQQKLNEEIMKLYQEEHYNPASGCLPLLIQLPILFALYGVITRPITYISAFPDKLSAIQDAITKAGMKLSGSAEIDMLSKVVGDDGTIAGNYGDGFSEIVSNFSEIKGSFSLGGVDLTQSASFTWPMIMIPILTFIFAFASTKIIKKFTYQPNMTADGKPAPGMGMMDIMMPLLSVWISFSISSAIAIYWMFQNVLSAVQQYALYKLYPIPPVTEEQIKEAELQMKGKNKEHKKQVVLSDDDIDDYDKTVETDKSQKPKKQEGMFSSRKAGISPKVRDIIKKNGNKPLKAKKKI